MKKTYLTKRVEIATIKDEIEALESVGRSPAEARAVVATQVATLVEDGRRLLGSRIAEVAAGGALPRLLDLSGLKGEPILAALLGADAVMAALEPALAAVPPAPDRAERRAKVETLRAELLAAEIEEEALIVVAESRGECVVRRPDADPAAVLYLPPAKAA